MAPITATLLARGLVERAAADGRSHRLRLSHAGAAMAAQVAEAIAVHEARFLGDVAAHRREALVAMLRAIRVSG